MKDVDVNSRTYIDSNKENNKALHKFEGGYHVRIWKYKNIFAKVYTPICFVETFMIEKVKKTLFCRHMLSVT